MKVNRVEVVPHARNPAGSFAVIKLFGISQLDGPPLFQLTPAALDGAAPSGWPTGDLKPLGVRAGTDLVELLIGPDIVKATAIRPGVAVQFRMPSVGADSRIVWPDLSGLGDRSAGSSNAPPADNVLRAPLVMPSATMGDKPAGAANRHRPERPPAEQGLSRLKLRGPAAAAANAARSAAAAASGAADVPQPSAVLMPSGLSTAQPHGRQIALAASPTSSASGINLVPFGLGLIIVLAMLVTFLRTTEIEGSGVTLFAALRAAVAKPNVSAETKENPNAVLARILNVGTTSPAGIDASNVSQHQALKRANKLLAAAQTEAEREEASFWLSKALSHRLSEPRLVWALTQLGTAYASKDVTQKPNYEAARLLWGWAADAGDAQAACFLGRLYEHGLGVPSDSKAARAQYERAQRLGGCPGLDQALLRVGN